MEQLSFLIPIPKNQVLILVFMNGWNLKDTHKENTPSNKTLGLPKNINLDIWVIGTLNQLLGRGSYPQIKFKKK